MFYDIFLIWSEVIYNNTLLKLYVQYYMNRKLGQTLNVQMEPSDLPPP